MNTVLGQLTFEDVLVNPSVATAEEMRLGNQAYEIYKLFFKFRRVSNVQMQEIAMQYNARIYEIRKALARERTGKTIALVSKAEGGLNYYSLVNEE